MLSQMLVVNAVLTANEVYSVEGNDELIKKCRRLSKTRKLFKSQKLSKSKKLSKSPKSAKSRKKLSKNRNLPRFNTKEKGSSFLTSDARTTFNRFWLAFIKAPILWHFDLEYHFLIETNASGYEIGDALSQLISETRPDEIVTKTD